LPEQELDIQNPEAIKGVVFNVQRYSIHDGPGIRTTVFLKGCPIRCFWCQNPESQSIKPEIMFTRNACTRCGNCINDCPNGAIRIGEHYVITDRTKCTGCGNCVDACPVGARVIEGRYMTVGEIMDVVLKDRKMYEKNSGGLTLSGGDATMQPDFSAALLQSAKAHGLHTVIETCGYTKWEVLERLLRSTDFLFYDIKTLDSERHREGTGFGNELILENAVNAAKMMPEMHVRCPMIPRFNDSKEDVDALARFVTEELKLPAENFTILRYNKYAEDKYARLDRDEGRTLFEPQSPEYMEMLNAVIHSYSLSFG
jgi:pyruvate formate lyase activating enzyme